MHTQITQDKVRKLARWVQKLLKSGEVPGLAALNNAIWQQFGATPGGGMPRPAGSRETPLPECGWRIFLKCWHSQDYLELDYLSIEVTPTQARAILDLSEAVQAWRKQGILPPGAEITYPAPFAVYGHQWCEAMERMIPTDDGCTWGSVDPRVLGESPVAFTPKLNLDGFVRLEGFTEYGSHHVYSSTFQDCLLDIVGGRAPLEARVALFHEDQATGLYIPGNALIQPIPDFFERVGEGEPWPTGESPLGVGAVCHPVFAAHTELEARLYMEMAPVVNQVLAKGAAPEQEAQFRAACQYAAELLRR